ncbi:AAA family ATPase [Brevibacillus thermoruber]|uniref:AAA family ATPase n=1 Tax=Brevibacillus thermoruber TaxID=33942 RepID=UPI004042B99A
MKILSLMYKDKKSNLLIEKIEFQNLTLLVGASGVGKTKILKALLTLRQLARGQFGESLSIEWELKFKEEGLIYVWSGETQIDNKDELYDSEENYNAKSIFIKEKLEYIVNEDDTKIIFVRDKTDVTFNESKVPKVTSTQSCINIFSDEDILKPVRDAFNKMYFFNFETERKQGIIKKAVTEGDENIALNVVREMNMPILGKLAISYHHFPNIFEQIKDEFIEIFNFVEDVRFKKKQITFDEVNIFLDLQIKEYDCDWISYREMSSGMLKTLLYIGMIHLVPENSMILIDEFENSLGINCIDLLSSASFEENIQFIITSHHPYIINNISMSNWKIISRRAGNIVAKDSKDLNLGKSKHEAFKQLINLSTYREGR